MITDTEKFAPYAPSPSVLSVIRRLRERSLPDPLTAQELTRMSISEGLTNRTLRALSFLGLIDEEGHRTPTFERLGKASSNEYPELLGEVIKEAYKEVFTIIDPADATDIEIDNAFRLYEPRAQRGRMITLFRGLCQEAGLMSGEPPQSVKRSRMATPKPTSQSNGARRPKSEPKDAEFESVPDEVSTSQASQPVKAKPITSTEEYVIMQGVLSKLPFAEKAWTQAQRAKWLKAVAANVDMLFELKDPPTEIEMEEDMYRP